jgi:hypothetical protein
VEVLDNTVAKFEVISICRIERASPQLFAFLLHFAISAVAFLLSPSCCGWFLLVRREILTKMLFLAVVLFASLL